MAQLGLTVADDQTLPELRFATPRSLPDPEGLPGRVVVLDIAFAADGMGKPFDEVTGPFIRGLGWRLAAWVDHHDHDRHAEFQADPRFVLACKSEHGACPEMITPDLVERAGAADTIVAHLDLDGLYAAAKWIRKGHEPYRGADDDARAVDTRKGKPSAKGDRIDRALRAHFRDDGLKHRIVRYLVEGAKDRQHWEAIDAAADDFDAMEAESERLADQMVLRGQIAYIDVGVAKEPYDKTTLLLLGQAKAPVAMVRTSGVITIAANFSSGLDFVKLLDLGGGMPTRVSLADKREPEVIEKINRVLTERAAGK